MARMLREKIEAGVRGMEYLCFVLYGQRASSSRDDATRSRSLAVGSPANQSLHLTGAA